MSIEDFIITGQLTERFHIEKVRARDLWHQSSRFWRKLLAHTASIKVSLSIRNEPLQFEHFVSHESCAIFRFGNSHIALNTYIIDNSTPFSVEINLPPAWCP